MVSPSDAEERIARLEELTFFQEKRLQELDSALASQQRQLDRAEKELARAIAVLRLLREKLQELPDTELPPHFMPERW